MKLDDFLKCKKVRCVEGNYSHGLIRDKVYDVISTDYNEFFGKLFIKIDKNGIGTSYLSDFFEPVLDSAENPLKGVELTPEFEAVVPHVSEFKAGDPVYWGLKSRIFKIHRFMSTNVLDIELDGGVTSVHKDELCPATLENYGKLCSLFERIDFEQPPKELKGSDLTRAMVDKGWFIVDCYVSAISDEDALRFRTKRMQVALFGDGLFTDGVKQFPFAVPFDSKTGEPLTESILDE